MAAAAPAAPPSGDELVAIVRRIWASADASGVERPRRPTLMRETGATKHQVEKVMRLLDAEDAEARRAARHLASVPAATMAPPAPPVAEPAVDSPPPVAAPPATPAPPVPDTPGPWIDDTPTATLPTVQADMVSPQVEHGGGGPGGPGGGTPPPPPATMPPAPRPHPKAAASLGRRWPLLVIGLAAMVAVWGGWVELGSMTGFGPVVLLPGISEFELDTSIVLPLGIEAYAAYSLKIWLDSRTLSPGTRTFARWSALSSLVLGGAAQIAAHLITVSGETTAPWQITAAVATVPVITLALAAALSRRVANDLAA